MLFKNVHETVRTSYLRIMGGSRVCVHMRGPWGERRYRRLEGRDGNEWAAQQKNQKTSKEKQIAIDNFKN